jgi:hypothetical protein
LLRLVVRTAEDCAAWKAGDDEARNVDEANAATVPGDDDGGDAFHL